MLEAVPSAVQWRVAVCSNGASRAAGGRRRARAAAAIGQRVGGICITGGEWLAVLRLGRGHTP
jgi:hypothetical protein